MVRLKCKPRGGVTRPLQEKMPAISASRYIKQWILAFILSGLYVSLAQAQAIDKNVPDVEICTEAETLKFRGGTARLENDLFAGTDQNYTNGVSFTLVSHDITGEIRMDCLPAPARLHAKLIEFVNPGFWENSGRFPSTQNVVVKFGQSIHTPEDFSRTDLIPDDRPYAGLLYTGLSWNRRSYLSGSNSEMLDTREITLGVIGPWSGSEQTQNLVHDAIGEDKFLGWQHQLKNEPAFQLALDRKFKNFRGAGAITPGFSADSIRSLGLRIGNIETSATLGFEGRIGLNLPNDFGSYPIRPGAENRPPSASSHHAKSGEFRSIKTRPRLGVYLFGMLEAKLVAYDFSLDGNLFRSSHSVTRRPGVIQAAFGVGTQGILAGHDVRLAVMRVYRSREFETQDTNHVYGSIELSIEF